MKRRKSGQRNVKDGEDRQNNSSYEHSSSSNSSEGMILDEEHGTELLLVRTESVEEQEQKKESSPIQIYNYPRYLLEHEKQLQDDARSVTLDHLIKSSLELDDTAKKKIELIKSIGSKRFAMELIELLESASKCIEQNANLLKIIRHHLGIVTDAKQPIQDGKN
jgi:hypothetical protein